MPPASDCDEVNTDLAHGETWEAEIPTGVRVHARPPTPDGYTDEDDFTFKFTPNHLYNGAPEEETVCTRTTRGSLYPFGWSDVDCEDPGRRLRSVLDAFEPHDNQWGSYRDIEVCDPV